MTIVEGESLVNDGSGLVLYRVAVAAVLTGSFSLLDTGGLFVVVAGGGVAFGLASAGSSARCAAGSTTRRPRSRSRS